MAVHTPEVCYRGAGYDLRATPAPALVRDENDVEAGTLWSARFTKQGDASSDLQLYWGWDAGDGWQAPANPRWEFRGRPYLYKLYVSQELSDPSAADRATEFLRSCCRCSRTCWPRKKVRSAPLQRVAEAETR